MASTDENDNAEFMEVAVHQPDPDDSERPENSFVDNEISNDSGAPSQYAHNREGFVPTTSTVPTLPAGVYSIEVVNEIHTFMPKKIVTDKLLRLPDSKSDTVIVEIEKFWTLKERFKQFGFTHKRGFLLWGPPGSGKTCTVAVVTEQMVKGGDIVILASCPPDILSMMLGRLRKVEQERRVVVVLEDIDTVIKDFGESDVLALLDGETSIDNVIYIATTNYPEHLDGRVINRPSRFDRVVKIGMPSFEARLLYLQSRELELSDKELTKWAELTDGFSLAHLKEVVVGVMCFGDEVDSVVRRLNGMKKIPKSEAQEGPVGFGRSREET